MFLAEYLKPSYLSFLYAKFTLIVKLYNNFKLSTIFY